jgi:hypothetical protein
MAGLVTVAVCVPFRRSDRHRGQLWDYVHGHLERCDLDMLIIADRAGEGFHRAGSRNDAAEIAIAAGADVLLFHDADMVLRDAAAYHTLTKAATDAPGMVVGFDTFHYLGLAATRRALDGADPWTEPRYHRTFRGPADWVPSPYGQPTSWLPNCWVPFGGITAMRTDVWQSVGGMDERFHGWGCEDVALEAAVSALHGMTWRVAQPTIHMWHTWQGKTANPENNPLWERYGQVRGDQVAMRALLTEPGGPLHDS